MNPDKDMRPEPPREETLQERSARLEAEAMMGKFSEQTDTPEPQAFAGADTESLNKIDALKVELAQAKDQTLRALAEAENARKRAAREREDASKYAISGFSKDLIGVADNLRRALEAVPADLHDDPRMKSLIDGIEATEREMLKGFEKAGIRKLNPLDEMFNPNFHEVMFETPGTGKPGGTIIQVIETGYILHDRLLRPARVGVAKAEPGMHAVDTSA